MSKNRPLSPLDDRGPLDPEEDDHAPALIQLFVGVVIWAIIAGSTYASMATFGVYGFHIIWPLLLAAILLEIHLRRAYHWKLLGPGVFIGMALTCLIGFGICAHAFKQI